MSDQSDAVRTRQATPQMGYSLDETPVHKLRPSSFVIIKAIYVYITRMVTPLEIHSRPRTNRPISGTNYTSFS